MESKQELEDLVQLVDYTYLNEEYKPSAEAIDFINFIKMVNGGEGEENKSPVFHMDMIEKLIHGSDNLFVCFRGGAKTTVVHEYAFLYIAVYGEFYSYGEVSVAMYVSDTIDNGVKSMREQLEFRYDKSDFLKKYVPHARFTKDEWEFTNADGKQLYIKGFGASTGVRGFKRYGQRPTWLGLDDLMSDKNAESPTITADIKKVVYKAARQAMHPKKRKINWTGTPFNKKDPLYAAAGSAGWNTSVYPICEKYPCTVDEFKGAWEDRFTFEFVKGEYETLNDNGEIHSFNQELMLRIASDEDRLISESDYCWFKRSELLQNKSRFNFYITTDFATSERASADYSVITVWAVNNNGQFFYADGIIQRQLMDKNIDDLFRLAQLYKPQAVGVEVTGQQGGFIQWIQKEMMRRNVWFTLASENNEGKPGIRPINNKLSRLHTIQPWFSQGKVFFPEEWKGKDSRLIEATEELSGVTRTGIKSKHDDWLDTLSMLSVMPIWLPSEETPMKHVGDDMWEIDEPEESSNMDSYIV